METQTSHLEVMSEARLQCVVYGKLVSSELCLWKAYSRRLVTVPCMKACNLRRKSGALWLANCADSTRDEELFPTPRSRSTTTSIGRRNWQEQAGEAKHCHKVDLDVQYLKSYEGTLIPVGVNR